MLIKEFTFKNTIKPSRIQIMIQGDIKNNEQGEIYKKASVFWLDYLESQTSKEGLAAQALKPCEGESS